MYEEQLNLNFGIESPLNIKLHPLVLMQIMQYSYRAQTFNNKKCIGTILGNVYPNHIEITNCFSIPQEQDGIQKVADGAQQESDQDQVIQIDPDMKYHKSMFAINQKVYNKEVVLGAFVPQSNTLEKDILILSQTYMKPNIFQNQRNLKTPLILTYDPHVKDGHFNLQAYIYENNLEYIYKILDQTPFKVYEINVSFNNEKLHEVVPFITNQDGKTKDFNLLNLQNMKNLISETSKNIQVIREKVQKIINNQEQPDEQFGKKIKNLLNLQPIVTHDEFQEMIEKYVNDTVLIQFLSNLGNAHTIISEKLNSVKQK